MINYISWYIRFNESDFVRTVEIYSVTIDGVSLIVDIGPILTLRSARALE